MWRLRQMELDEQSDEEDSDYWDESTDESDEDEDEDETQQRHSSTYLDRSHDTALLAPAGATLRHCAL